MNPKSPSTRRAFFTIPRYILQQLGQIDKVITKDGRVISFKGIPDDIKIVGMEMDIMRDGLVIMAEHPSFPEIPEGGMPDYPIYETETIYSKIIKVSWE